MIDLPLEELADDVRVSARVSESRPAILSFGQSRDHEGIRRDAGGAVRGLSDDSRETGRQTGVPRG